VTRKSTVLKFINLVGGGLVQFIILEKRIILTTQIGLVVWGLVVLSNVEDKNNYSLKVDSSGGQWSYLIIIFDIVNSKSIYLVVSGSVQFL
jgi:ATP-dependent protease ClpP protease subunit